MLVDKTIDIYARSENVLLPKGEVFLFDISTPVFTESIHLGQYINRLMPRNVDALGFLDHSMTIVYLMFAGFLLTSVFIVVFQCIQSNNWNVRIENSVWPNQLKKFSFYLIRLKAYYESYPASSLILTKINLIFVFYLLFTQLILDLLSSNIKTGDVIVDSR